MNLLSFCYLGLRLHVSLDRRWMGQVMGLCDNFNDESNSEWITHSGALTTIAYDFAKSWKIEGPSPCVDDYNPDDYSPCVSIFLYIIHNKRASSVDPDKAVYYELPGLVQCCLQTQLHLHMYFCSVTYSRTSMARTPLGL